MMQSFNVTGMSCDHCVRAVMGAISNLDPAARVTVDLAGGRVTVEGESADRAALAAAIAHEGYDVAGAAPGG